jgi:nitrogen fixation protein FixH
LKYQDHINKLNNAKALTQDLVIRQQSESKVVQFLFPKELANVGGKILFYRASDSTKDFSVNIRPNAQGIVEVPIQDLAAGSWIVKVDWSGGGKAFYKEDTLVL